MKASNISRRHSLLGGLVLGGGCALAPFLFPFLARAAMADNGIGTVERLKGSASINRGGSQSVISAGDPVAVGDVVTTLADSRLRIALNDGSQVNLGELTRITLAEFTFTRETLSRQAVFDLQSGLVQAITAKAGAGSSFAIRTGNAVAASRSTQWIVEAKKAETTVLVQEGKVDVQEAGLGFRALSSAEQDKAILLSAGQVTTIGKLGGGLGPQMAEEQKLAAYLAALSMD